MDDRNTVIEPGVDVQADVAAINSGLAKRIGNTFEVKGRVYGVHDGTLYPISGPGFQTLDRGGLKALGVFNKVWGRSAGGMGSCKRCRSAHLQMAAWLYERGGAGQ